MKIVLLGPVNSEKYFGGVAVFTEELADALQIMGHDVVIVTGYSQRDRTEKGVKIFSTTNKATKLSSLTGLHKMLRFLKSFGPDIIIESLEYGMINLFYKGGAFKVYFLHGFPTKRMSLARRIIIRWSQKLFCARSDSIIANSGLTKIINEEIFGMRVDGVINPGVSDEFIRLCANVTPQNRDPIVLYVGRLVKEKGIFEIASAIKDVQKRIPGSCLWIVGDGPEREALLNFLERNSVQYVYYGRTDSKKKLAEIYQSSRVFISLNQHEPFGIVYAEALLSGCVVVCPATGGHTDFSTKFTDRFRYVKNIRSISSISEAILDGVKTWSPHFIDDRTVINEFSYNDVALEILAQVNSDCD